MADEMILWTDTETTGLTPWEGHKLLQVAAVITDTDLNVVSDEFERVVFYDQDEAARLRDAVAGDFVREMHSKTGLWDRLPDGTPIGQVDDELFAFVSEFAPQPKQARLAGNSIRLDLNFSEFGLPRTYAHLHYRSIDVSALAYVTETWGLTPGHFEKKKSHDALDDIRESIAELRWIKDHLMGDR